MKTMAVIMMLTGLAGCATQINYSDIRVGSRIEVLKPLPINADSARVSLQFGQVVSIKQLSFYKPNCRFISWQRDQNPQQILPDVFNVTKVVQKVDLAQRPGVYTVASLVFEAGSSFEDYVTEMQISSSRQPNIRQLICSHWEDPADASHLSLQQMQQAVGDYVRFINP